MRLSFACAALLSCGVPCIASVETARTLLRDGSYAAAEVEARAALAQAVGSTQTARALDALAIILVREGKASDREAAELARRAVTVAEDSNDAATLAASLFGLGEQLRAAGSYAEAEAAYRRAVALRDSAENLRGLATLRFRMADYAEAQDLTARALEVAERELGGDDPEVARLLVDLARTHRVLGDYAEARPVLDRALALQERTLGPGHLETATTLRELAELLRFSGDYAAARPVFEKALVIRTAILGGDSLEVADVLAGMSVLLRRVGISRDATCAEALPVAHRALGIAERVLGPDHPDLAPYVEELGWCSVQCTGDNDRGVREAKPIFLRSLAIHHRAFGPDHLAAADSLEGLGFVTGSLDWYRKKLDVEGWGAIIRRWGSRSLSSPTPRSGLAARRFRGLRWKRSSPTPWRPNASIASMSVGRTVRSPNARLCTWCPRAFTAGSSSGWPWRQRGTWTVPVGARSGTASCGPGP